MAWTIHRVNTTTSVGTYLGYIQGMSDFYTPTTRASILLSI